MANLFPDEEDFAQDDKVFVSKTEVFIGKRFSADYGSVNFLHDYDGGETYIFQTMLDIINFLPENSMLTAERSMCSYDTHLYNLVLNIAKTKNIELWAIHPRRTYNYAKSLGLKLGRKEKHVEEQEEEFDEGEKPKKLKMKTEKLVLGDIAYERIVGIENPGDKKALNEIDHNLADVRIIAEIKYETNYNGCRFKKRNFDGKEDDIRKAITLKIRRARATKYKQETEWLKGKRIKDSAANKQAVIVAREVLVAGRGRKIFDRYIGLYDMGMPCIQRASYNRDALKAAVGGYDNMADNALRKKALKELRKTSRLIFRKCREEYEKGF
jgi:hypothetical protein